MGRKKNKQVLKCHSEIIFLCDFYPNSSSVTFLRVQNTNYKNDQLNFPQRHIIQNIHEFVKYFICFILTKGRT